MAAQSRSRVRDPVKTAGLRNVEPPPMVQKPINCKKNSTFHSTLCQRHSCEFSFFSASAPHLQFCFSPECSACSPRTEFLRLAVPKNTAGPFLSFALRLVWCCQSYRPRSV